MRLIVAAAKGVTRTNKGENSSTMRLRIFLRYYLHVSHTEPLPAIAYLFLCEQCGIVAAHQLSVYCQGPFFFFSLKRFLYPPLK